MKRWGAVMKIHRFAPFAAATMVLVAAPALADVTITSVVAGKGAAVKDASTETITYIKGAKMRTEMDGLISILDADTRQMILLNAKKQEAEIFDITKLAADMQKTIAGEPKVSLTPTGETKTLLDRTCTEYTVSIAVPMKMGNSDMMMSMSGPLWVAKGAPGSNDYAAFYRKAAENGLFFGNPQLARGQGAQLKSQTEMYRAIANLGGIPYQIDAQMRFEGGGMMAGMMNKLGGMTTVTTVTAVSTAPIAADLFTVPAGYKTKTR
jgi:hypothetical protein